MIPQKNGQSRRQFIKQTGTVAVAAAGAGMFNLSVVASGNDASISIVVEADLQQPPVQWAVKQLRDALTARGVANELYEHMELAPRRQECILVAEYYSKFPESFTLGWGKS